jgi:hypothetical protein
MDQFVAEVEGSRRLIFPVLFRFFTGISLFVPERLCFAASAGTGRQAGYQTPV